MRHALGISWHHDGCNVDPGPGRSPPGRRPHQRRAPHVPPGKGRLGRPRGIHRPPRRTVLRPPGRGRVDDSERTRRTGGGLARRCPARVRGRDRAPTRRALHPARERPTGEPEDGPRLGLRRRLGSGATTARQHLRARMAARLGTDQDLSGSGSRRVRQRSHRRAQADPRSTRLRQPAQCPARGRGHVVRRLRRNRGPSRCSRSRSSDVVR